MDGIRGSGRDRGRGEGISEAIGFILILAVVIITLTIYLLYMMPSLGREGEISQMSQVRYSFSEFKLDIDTLWTSRQCTTEYGPALTLGSGETGGIMGFFPFFRPARAGAVLAINQRVENITITSDSHFLVSSGGLSQSGAIGFTPSVIPANMTPQHFYTYISTSDLLTRRGVHVQGSAWDAWVNITPNYFGYTRYNLTSAGGKVTEFKNWTEYQWNSTDITVSTYADGRSVATDLPVYRGISSATVYPVDLISPVYGISGQFQSPQNISVSLSDNTGQIAASYLLSYGYLASVSNSTSDLGSIEYRSNNIWYTPQTYYYQLGGVFLEQEEGSTTEVPPSISLSMVNSSPVVRIGKIRILGSVSETEVSGSGPITVTSAVTDIANDPLPIGDNTRWVNVTIQAASVNAARMWNRTLKAIAVEGGLPLTSYTTGTNGNVAFLNVTGDPQLYDIRLSVSQVNVSADYVLEYTSGGLSPSWRNVPGYVPPTSTPAVGLNATTTTLEASTNAPNYGDPVTFTATVTGSIPTGNVTFVNGSVTLGTVDLSAGSASLVISNLPVGVNSVNATYNGNSYYSTSTSSAIQITVSSYTPPAGYVPWYNCAWTNRKNITIDKSKVVGSLTSFPVLLNFADTDLSTKAQTDGDDILFTKSDGTTNISHEIESYTWNSGLLTAWVKVDSLSSATTTSIYMYYGNLAAPNQEQKNAVWDANYKAVWHLNETGSGVSGEYKDSTSNGNNGWGGWGAVGSPPLRANGKIGYGQDFTSATNHFIGINEVGGSLGITGPLTIEAWMKGDTWTDPGGGYRSVIGRQYGSASGDSYQTAVHADGSNPSTAFTFLNTGSVFGATGVATGSWYFLATNFTGVGGGGGTAYIHVNGVHQGNWAGLSTSTDNNPVIIGGMENDGSSQPTQLFDGMIDEVRISNVARGDNWFATEFNNQNSPSTFASRMPQESSSCAPAFVQVAADDTFSSNVNSVSLSKPSTAGDLMVVSFGWGDPTRTVTSVTDNRGNTYAAAVGATTWNGGASKSATYYAYNIGGGVTSVTVTLSGDAGSWFEVWTTEYSGIKTSDPKDVTSVQTGTGTVMNSGSATTNQASELIYGYGHTSGAATMDPPFTTRNTMNANFVGDHTVSSTGSYSASGQTTLDNWICMMVTFKGK